MTKRKVLWLCSWYPDKTEPYNGDFVKRHAEAVSAFCDVHVIHVVRDVKGAVTDEIKTEDYEEQGFSETIIYYNVNGLGIRLYEKYLSHHKHEQLYRHAVRNYMAENGRPDLVHVHTGMKAGTTALWIKKQFNIPYVVTEHWSGFLDNATEKFSDTAISYQRQWRSVIRHATGVSAVSAVLAEGLKNNFPGTTPVIIPNVVDTRIFFADSDTLLRRDAPVFVHISGMQELKNPLQIIKAFKTVSGKLPGARLQMIGAIPPSLVSFVQENGMEGSVSFFAEMPQEELVTFIRQSAALILYSSYETFGCVIIEANACEVPVIVSDIPVFHERVTEGENGTFVPLANENELAAAMLKAAEGSIVHDRKKIATPVVEKYSYPVVGNQFANLYAQALTR